MITAGYWLLIAVGGAMAGYILHHLARALATLPDIPRFVRVSILAGGAGVIHN